MDRVVDLMPAVGLNPGTELPGLEVGPFTLTDFVRWAAYQENWLRIHYDRAYATQRVHGADCIQSGHHRTALLTRMITDWLGTRGRLVRLAVRHTAPVFPGDSIRCRGRIRSSTLGGGEMVVELDISAVTTDARLVSEGTAVVGIASPAPGERRREQR
jgi:acyl dehydratase